MLIELSIRDLAIVQRLDLGFASGLTILTGETGAGKSILLNALGLALGERADSGYIRPGAPKAEVSLRLDLRDAPLARAWLEAQSLDPEEGEECLVRRVVTADGRSRAFINGSPVTLQALQEFGQGVVEIHGQHAHVRLMRAPEQRRLVDVAADNATRVAELGEIFREWRKLQETLSRREAEAGDRASRLDLLRFQVDELSQWEIESLDYPALVESHDREANMERIMGLTQAALEGLYEGEGASVAAQLARVQQNLAELMRLEPLADSIGHLVGESQIQIKEAAGQLRRLLDRAEMNPERLARLEEQMAAIHRLARKHQVRPEALPEVWVRLSKELEGLAAGEGSLEDLQHQCASLQTRYQVLSQAISERRKQAAARLQLEIRDMVRTLGMPEAVLEIDVLTPTEAQPTAEGLDQVEFRVSANPGLPAKPLAKVASGGELSRISLAIQVALSSERQVPTLIFDEVDSGIGGGVAEVVGQKMRLLGQDRQVFAVTHLAQVACHGHAHLRVEKQVIEGVTHSTVLALEGEDRVLEIGRMLGGRTLTESTRAHAREMLSLGQKAPA